MKNNILIMFAVVAIAMFVTACTQSSAGNVVYPSATADSGSQASASAVSTPSTPASTPASNPTTDASASASSSATVTSSASTSGTVKELKIEGYNFGWRVVNDVQINKGDTVHLTVTDTEGTHGFALPDYNINLAPIPAGQSMEVTFVADKAGTFTYFCDVPCGPGHRSMRGTLTVNA